MKQLKTFIAVDFDGTLCKNLYPAIGEPNRLIIDELHLLQKYRNCDLILWTCRIGKALDEAVDWCKKQGLRFDYINENAPFVIKKYGLDCRKVSADYYIDDKSFFGSEEEKTYRIERLLYKIYVKLSEVHGGK